MSLETIWTVSKQGTLSPESPFLPMELLWLLHSATNRGSSHTSPLLGTSSFPHFLPPPLISMTGWGELTSYSTDNELLGKLSLVFDSCSFRDRGSHTLRRKLHFLSYILAIPSSQLCSLLNKTRIEALSM